MHRREAPGVMEPVVIWRRPSKRAAHTPLVVLLHGRGADEHDLIDLSNVLPKSYAYASVRGYVDVAEGGYTWFENRGPARPIASSVRESVASFRTWLDRPEISASSAPVYLLGFSAGMMMAGAVLLDDPARFSGAVLLSGALAFDTGIPMTSGRLAGVPVFHGHGTQDDVIPRELAVRSEKYLAESGADLTARRYPIAHSISHREMTDITGWFAER